MAGTFEPRLARWSRLKHESRRRGGAAAPVEAHPTDAEPPAAAAPEAETPPPDLPAVDALDGDSDYTPFLAPGVPDDLARLALRKLWRTDPVFANLDGLNDYDEDFTVIETLASAIQEVAEKAGEGSRDGEPAEDADPTTADAGDEPDNAGEPEAAAADPDAEPSDERGS